MKTNICFPKLLQLVSVVFAMTAFMGCNKEKAEPEAFEHDTPIDMTDILQAYNWLTAPSNYDRGSYIAVLQSDMPDYDFYLFCDTSFVLRLPEYSGATQPFLAQAEDFFNSCALAWNIYSNYEVYYRGRTTGGLGCEEDASHCTESISVDIINNKELRKAAQAYKDSILTLMNLSLEEMSDDDVNRVMGYVTDFSSAIEQHSYHFFEETDAFFESLVDLRKTAEEMVEDKFQRYLDADEKQQLGVILDEMSECANFDEQCALWLRWANCKKSVSDESWLIATAIRLMKSGHYNPLLQNIWMSWRAMCQTSEYGSSRDSNIPNDFYNSYRQLCYQTCLKRIERQPDDIFAMNCAAAIGGRTNINRFGQNYFGNEAMIEEMMLLPNRFEDDDE